jgi:serine/threonine protein kinase
MRFAHTFGLCHGDLTANNIILDSDNQIQIVDFSPIRLEGHTQKWIGNFSGEGWKPDRDISAVNLVCRNIQTGNPLLNYDYPSKSLKMLKTVSDMTEEGKSFDEIFERLNDECRFELAYDTEVSEFIQWVESFEQSLD